MWPYMKFMVTFDSWISHHYNFDLLEKTSFSEAAFLKSSHFCAITSIFWQIYLQSRLIYNFRFTKFLYRPDWFAISDSRSGIKFMIGTPVKFPISNIIRDRWSDPTDNKRHHLVMTWSYDMTSRNSRVLFWYVLPPRLVIIAFVIVALWLF